ncbi:HAD family hydrolase [Sporomusa sp.]|uniref:HAD family hydrolase n=1 Tax=Sporomusa sp. TaxID=2078658 RepID=UPI002B9EB031|nr:HAD hydrolase-like protein [Sporomusa sp.]HWR45842.1 HAD hydrolase-like protein [Sporomusa sp.]
MDYIFLDLDGPILDGRHRHYNCFRDIVVRGGGTPMDLVEYWELKRDRVSRKEMLRLSCYHESYERFMEEWMDCIETKEYLQFDTLKPFIHQTLRKWRKHASAILLVTMRNKRENLLWQLKRHNLANEFDEIINCNTNQGNGKIDALKNWQFTRAVVVGDTEEDTKTARLLGVPAIAIINGLRKREHLEAQYFAEEIAEIDLANIIATM